MKIYTVGGAVRDQLLGCAPKDTDYVVVGATPGDMFAQGFKQVGADFPVFIHPVTGDEYALARTERKVGPGYQGFAVDFNPGVTIEEDLFRRDLTINSMAMDEHGVLVDPYGGAKDLTDRVLRHTSDAFEEDPIRILRISRFLARYDGFTIAQPTLDLMKMMVGRGDLAEVTPERVWLEVEKSLTEPHTHKMFSMLADIGALNTALSPYASNTMHLQRLEMLQTGDSRYDLAAMGAEAVFTFIASEFSPRNYDRRRVPNTYRSINDAVHRVLAAIRTFDGMSSAQKVQFFRSAGGFNQQQRQYIQRVVKIVAQHCVAVSDIYALDKLRTIHRTWIALCDTNVGAHISESNPTNIRKFVTDLYINQLELK